MEIALEARLCDTAWQRRDSVLGAPFFSFYRSRRHNFLLLHFDCISNSICILPFLARAQIVKSILKVVRNGERKVSFRSYSRLSFVLELRTISESLTTERNDAFNRLIFICPRSFFLPAWIKTKLKIMNIKEGRKCTFYHSRARLCFTFISPWKRRTLGICV